MQYVSGEILTEQGFEKGYIGFEKRNILERGKGIPPKKPICKGLIIPLFYNMHTHIGDSFVRDKKIKLTNDIEKLVAPPNGLKYKLLKEANQNEIIDGMEKSIDTMIKTGTQFFCDFRENGIMGVCLLKTALQDWRISSLILSRPDELFYNKNEVDILLNNADGIGLSSISDWDYSETKKIAEHAKRKNKFFALHASERIREDIDLILDLKPDMLVHMTQAREEDFIRVSENNIPVVVCPRSNYFFNIKPKFELIKKTGVKILFGTDNAMINNPSIIDEILFVKQKTNLFSDFELLHSITYSARKVLNHECDILGSNSKAGFVVLQDKTIKPIYLSLST